jgi:hypothetical protein
MAAMRPARPAAWAESALHHLMRRRKSAPQAIVLKGRFGSLSFELDDFVLDVEFLTLQILDRRLIGERAVGFLIDGAFERCVLFFECLDAI